MLLAGTRCGNARLKQAAQKIQAIVIITPRSGTERSAKEPAEPFIRAGVIQNQGTLRNGSQKPYRMQSISFNGCAVDQIDAVCLPVFLFFKKLLNMCSCFLGPTVFVPEPLGIQSNVAQRAVCIAEEPVVTVRLITPMRAAVVLGIFGTQSGTGVAGFAQVLAAGRCGCMPERTVAFVAPQSKKFIEMRQ